MPSRSLKVFFLRLLLVIVFGGGLIACSAINNSIGAPTSGISSLKPANVLTSAGTRVVLVRWNAVTDNAVSGYRVYRSLSASANFDQLVELATVTQYADRSVSLNTTYFYRIAAIDNRGNLSQFSDIVSATPSADTVAPATPQGATATALNRSIKLTWQLNSETDLIGYVIRRQADGGNFEQIATAGAVTQYTDSAVTVGVRYRYQIGAVDLSDNTSPFALTNEVVAAVDVTPPGAPIFASATALDGGAQLTWNTPTENDVAQYQLFRQTGSDAAVLVAQLGLVTGFQDSGLRNGTVYTYRLVAIDTAGNRSSTSNPISVTPEIDRTPPGMPQQLTAVGRPTSVLLAWQSRTEPDVSRYAVYRSAAGSSSVQYVGSVAPPSTIVQTNPFSASTASQILTYTDLGLQTGRTYTYYVSAIDRAGNESLRAGVIVVTDTDITAPTAPTPRSLYSVGSGTTADPYLADNGSVTLIWNSSPEADVNTYEIYEGTSPDFTPAASNKIGTVPATTLRYTRSGLTNSTTVYYRIIAVDDLQNKSAASDPVAFQPRADAVAPNPPQHIRTSAANNLIVITWDPPTDPNVVGTQVYYRTSLNQPFQLLSTLPATQNRFAHTDLVNNILYYYDVRFVGRTGIQSQSDTTIAATPVPDTTAPNPPAQISGISLSGKIRIYIQESDSIDVQFYQLFRQSSATGTRTLVHTWIPAERQSNGFYYFEDTVTPETPFYYTAVAVDYSNLTGASPQVVLSALADVDPPPKVLGTSVVAGSKSVLVSWSEITGVSDLAGYTIYRGTSTGSLTQIQAVSTVLQYTDSGLTNGVTYFYAVRARDTAGNLGPSSDVVSIAPTSSILPPTNLTLTELDQQVRLAWSAPSGSGISGYSLYRSSTSGGPYTKIIDLGLILNYTDTGLTNDLTYYYVMRSVNGTSDESTNSEEKSATPHPDRTPPPIPTGLAVQVGAVNGGVRITWSEVSASDLAGYQVEASNQPGGPYTVLSNSVGLTTNFIASGLNNGVRTYFVVKSRDFSGNISNASAEISAVPALDTTGPEVPSIGTPQFGSQRIRLIWSRIANTFNDFKEYVILRATIPGGPYTEIDTVPAIDTLTYTDTSADLANGTPYFYTLKSRDTSLNLSDPSAEVSATPRQLAAPTNIRTVGGHKKITVIWDKLTDTNVGSYVVYMSPLTDGPFTAQQSTSPSTNSATITNLTNGSTYYFYVKAVDPLSQSSPESVHVNDNPVQDVTAPRAPTDLTGTPSGTNINLEWNAPGDSDVIGYSIYRQTLGSSQFDFVASFNAQITEAHLNYTDTSSLPSTAYSYVVRAFDEAGNVGPSSNVIQVTPQNANFQKVRIQTRGAKMTIGNIYVSWYALSTDERNNTPGMDYEVSRYHAQSSVRSVTPFLPQSITTQVHAQGQTFVRITVSAPTTGWVGIAYKPSNADVSLNNCNIIVGYVSGGTTLIQDQFGTSSTTRRADADLGGQNNATLYEGSESGGRTTITFFIPLAKSDNFDQAFLNDNISEFPSQPNTFFLLSGPSDSFTGAPNVSIPIENFSF